MEALLFVYLNFINLVNKTINMILVILCNLFSIGKLLTIELDENEKKK